jgi:hypothetical protein
MSAAQGEGVSLYKDASAPVEAHVRDLLGRMTLREKAAQIERTIVSPRALTELAASSVLNVGDSNTSTKRAGDGGLHHVVTAGGGVSQRRGAAARNKPRTERTVSRGRGGGENKR